MIYFISDTHFLHAKIIEFCNRPFSDVYEMNQKLQDNWNSTVSEDDTIYHLGDFGLGRRRDLQYILDRLNGKKHLIIGNHDHQNRVEKLEGWESVQEYLSVHIPEYKLDVKLLHYPMENWHHRERGSISLFGHEHGNGYSRDIPNRVEVSVECIGYKPISIDEIISHINKMNEIL